MPRVYNISNVTSDSPMAVNIGLVKIRPGKFKHVPDESINSKTHQLHGKVIWIGQNLPPRLAEKSPNPVKFLSMDRDQISLYLRSQTLTQLQEMLQGITPVPQVANEAPHRRYVYTIRAACFSNEVVLSPSAFYWLGRWNKLPNGDYQEI